MAPDAAPAPGTAQTAAPAGNHFNLLRLVLAALVLVSHSYEIVDGNRSREPLTQVFHSLSLGELAVDGFFLLSGYLIVQSWRGRPDLRAFLAARLLRIYPGFIVAALVCALVVGPLGAAAGTAYFQQMDWPRLLGSVLTLRGPAIPPVFEGTHYPFVNNALWTIKYEMACYLVVALCGVLGWAGRARFWWAAAGLGWTALLLLSAAPVLWPGRVASLVPGPVADGLRLFCFFAIGAVYQVQARQIVFSRRGVVVALLLLLALLPSSAWAEPALALFGSYLLFALAFTRHPVLQRLRPPTDVSYGLYLYAWPVQKLLVLLVPGLSAGGVLLGALAASLALGWLSWRWVEAPALQIKRRLLRA